MPDTYGHAGFSVEALGFKGLGFRGLGFSGLGLRAASYTGLCRAYLELVYVA